MIIIIIIVTQQLYESCMNWVHDPAPPASRRPHCGLWWYPCFRHFQCISRSSSRPATAQEVPEKEEKKEPLLNQSEFSAPLSRPSDPGWALGQWEFSISERDPTQVSGQWPSQDDEYPSFHSSHLPQPPFPAANENSAFQFGLDRCRIPGLYKPAHPDPRQDSTATLTRENISGSGFSSPSLLQPCNKPFSGLPSRRSMTSPTQEAGDAGRERPGIIYPLLLHATRPDTQVMIEAALPEAVALDRRAQLPTVLEIDETNLPQKVSSPRQRPSRRRSRKCRRNRSTGVYRPPKRSLPQGRWCE